MATHALITLMQADLGPVATPLTHIYFGVACNGVVTHPLGAKQAFFIDVLPGSVLVVCIRREQRPPHA